MAAAPDDPADGELASQPDLPGCVACTNLQKDPAQDQVQAEDQDQDRYLIDVKYDLCDAFESLASPEARECAEGHEALRRTLRIWLKHRANGTHPLEPDFLISQLQYGYTKDELSFDQLDPLDLATVRCLKDVSADLGLKVLLVLWKLTDKVVLKPDFKEHCEVLQDVPAGASKEWHQRHYSVMTSVQVEKLVDADDGELDVKDLPATVKNRADLLKRYIQRDGDIFYHNHFLKWESNLVSELRPRYSPVSDTDRGSSPVDPERTTATQCYQSCALLLVPQDELDCFVLAQIPYHRARAGIPQLLEQCTIPETRSRAMNTLHHLIKAGERGGPYFPRDDRPRVIMQLALDNLHYGLFNSILREVLSCPEEVGDGVLEAVRKAIAKHPHFKFAEISDSLLTFLGSECRRMKPSNVEESVRLLGVLAPTGDGVPLRPDVLSWIVDTAGPMILRISRYSNPDTYAKSPEGRAIVDLLVRYYPRASLLRFLDRILAPHAYNQSFMLGALAQMDRYAGEGTFDREEGRAVYERLAESTIQAMHPPLFQGAGKDRNTTALPDARDLAGLLYNCLKYQWEDLSMSLTGVIMEPLPEDLSDMREYWIPGFLFSLLHLLPDSETESSPRLGTADQQLTTQALVHVIAQQYLLVLLSYETFPLASAQDYWRHPVSCANHCELCNELNSFLQSQQQATSFAYHAGTAYNHITSQIEGCEDCKFVAEPASPDGLYSSILVVTKTVQTFEQRKAHFEARLAMASEFVAKLKEKLFQPRLDVLFGGQGESISGLDMRNVFDMPQRMADLWEGQAVFISPLDQPLFPEQREGDFPPSLAGTKRKAEDQGQR